ncbi:MAG: ATP-binding cassette domain-containing protein [Akkermansia sp.]|nr:ATP-binding cassette domain-containing protein [Akkermansia sp.]MBQ7024774.1 ATP-binding cassette domain-containing protein [Akkermansia sp.]
MVIAEHLHKTFGRFTAVKDATFTIDKGEIVGFLGPNGAGKTTTMKMLTGYLPPTAGSASIAGYDILDNPLEARRHLGYMPENVPLYDDMRVYEYLDYRARLKGICGKSVRTQIGEVIDKCGLEPKRKNLINTLSKGYRQRVGLADALLGNPDLLILDEPTNGLDPNQIRQIRELIRALSENHTVILSTHILHEVEMICNKVIIIDQGEIKAADTPANLTRNLRAAGRVTIEYKGDLNTIVSELEAFEPVKKVIVEDSSDGWNRLMVRAEPGTDTREKAAAIITAHGFPIRHIYRHIPSLEDVFVEMTRRD